MSIPATPAGPVPFPDPRPAVDRDADAAVTRLDAARAAAMQADDELTAALDEELRRTVIEAFPSAAWLGVDPMSWRDDPDRGVEVCVVVQLDGTVLHAVNSSDFPARPGETQWLNTVSELLTEYAELAGTSGWPEVCSMIEWECELRSIALTDEAWEQDCPPVCEHPAWP